jgi:hypothetical protein
VKLKAAKGLPPIGKAPIMNHLFDFLSRFVDKKRYVANLWRQLLKDRSRLFRRDTARAGRIKVKSQGIGAELDRFQSVV